MKAMRDDLHVLTGSYVLDAVSDTEREEFDRHLQHCPACDAEVRGLRETAARLALACAMTAFRITPKSMLLKPLSVMGELTGHSPMNETR